MGCSGSGIIGSHFVSEKMRTLAAICVTGNEFSAVAKPITCENCAALAKEAAEELHKSNNKINMIYMLTGGLATVGDAIIESIELLLKEMKKTYLKALTSSLQDY